MFVARKVVRSPLVSGTIVLILSCVTAAVLVGLLMLDSVLLKKLDVKDPDSLVRIHISSPTGGISNPVFKELRRSLDSFDQLFHYMSLSQYGLSIGGNDTILNGASVSETYFDSLGLVPSAGRLIQAADSGEGSSPVVVVSYSFWLKELAGNVDTIGSSVLLNGIPFTLVGVAPEGFHGLEPLSREDFWMPSEHIADTWKLTNRNWPFFATLGRLDKGYNEAAAQQELVQLGEAIAREFPEDGPKTDFGLMTQAEWIRLGTGESVVNTILLIFALVVLLLLIALSNLMALVSTRTESRKVEYATQLAIGAQRQQVLRTYFAENLLLCVLGWGLGLLLAYGATAYLVSELLQSVLSLDFGSLFRAKVLPYVILMPALYTIVLSAGGLRSIYQLQPAVELRSGGRASRTFTGRKVLIFIQVALAVVVVSACAWFVESLKNVERHDFRFESEGLVLVSTNLKLRGIQYNDPRYTIKEYRRLKEWMESLPNVDSVGLAELMPLRHTKISKVVVDGFDRRFQPDDCLVRQLYVGPGYFETMGVPILEGREIRFDEMGYPMTKVVVNEAFVERYWPDQVVIGRVFMPWQSGPEVTVVGVCANFSQDLGEEILPQVFIGFGWPIMEFHVRTSVSPEVFMPEFRRLLREKETIVPVMGVTTLQGSFRETFSSMHVAFYTAVFIAALSALIAASGLFALVRHFIASSRKEIGIRMALGAEPKEILRWILKECGTPVLGGCIAGIVIVYLIFPYASTLLFEVSRLDLPLLFSVLSVILLVAAASLLGPAIRAAWSSPVRCFGGRM